MAPSASGADDADEVARPMRERERRGGRPGLARPYHHLTRGVPPGVETQDLRRAETDDRDMTRAHAPAGVEQHRRALARREAAVLELVANTPAEETFETPQRRTGGERVAGERERQQVGRHAFERDLAETNLHHRCLGVTVAEDAEASLLCAER